MSKLSASVVVPTRGGGGRLPVLLGALEAQDTDDFEVIVVVDGDVDGTATVVESWKGRLRVRSIVFPENRGRSAALNAGTEAALGEIVIRSDDDLEPGHSFVSRHIARHRTKEGPVGVVGLTTNRYPDTPFARVYGNPADDRFLHQARALASEQTWRLWAANVSIEKSVHTKLGGYDERFRRYGWEDVDFGYRLHTAGIPIQVAPELLTVHHAAATTTVVRSLRALHAGAARETFVAIHGEHALPNPPAVAGIWNRVVRSASVIATERTLRTYGHAVDAMSRFLPHRVAEKLVALAVETGGVAGIRYPERARATF